MKFNETLIEGVYLIKPNKHRDNRGFFSRIFDRNEFFHKFINFDVKQISISHNDKKGTIRGMHYQDIPYMEEKIIQCVKGSIYDVILDLRDYSKTYCKWQSFNLTDENNLILYIDIGIAHGYQTLENNTKILYCMNQEYHSECAKTIKYNDQKYNIEWKLPVTNISERDK